MIGNIGKAVFLFNIGSKENFIDNSNIISFSTQEVVGSMLPSFTLNAYFRDFSIIKYLNETNILKISWGTSLDDLENNEFIITRKYYDTQSAQVGVYLSGFINKMKYINDYNMEISDNISGIERIKQVASKHFSNIKSSIEKSDDFQRWINAGSSDKDHITDVMYHTYLKDSCPLVAIKLNSDFVIKDLKTLAKAEPGFYIKDSGATENNIINYNGVRRVDINSGLINKLTGYDNKLSNIDTEYDNQSDDTIETKSMMTISKKLDKLSDITRVSVNRILNDNTHSNYWKAYIQNLNTLATYSSVSVTLAFGPNLTKLSVLDKVTIFNHLNGQKVIEDSGDYIVSSIQKIFNKDGLVNRVTLVKETLNLVEKC